MPGLSPLGLIPLFPLIGAALNAVLGGRLERSGRKRLVHWIAVGAMALSSASVVANALRLRRAVL